MSKKLKKKIAEITGLNGLEWEARQERAQKILDSPEWKQQLCNELVGLSFRELERYLQGVASERQKKEDSYERKLETYRTGNKRSPKSMRASSSKSTSTNSTGQQSSGSRTLKEILAQVYAPRVVETGTRAQYFSQLRLRPHTSESSDEILSDSIDGNDSTEE